jgi:hypothetical protein
MALPSKVVGSGIGRNLTERTDGLMPNGIPRGSSATHPEECGFFEQAQTSNTESILRRE